MGILKMLIGLQAVATHLAVAVEVLLLVELSNASLLQTIQRDLGGRALCISCMLGQQVVSKARRTSGNSFHINSKCI